MAGDGAAGKVDAAFDADLTINAAAGDSVTFQTNPTDIGKYLDFVLKLFFAFGISFEVPIATILLVWTGVTTPDKLAAKRPYIIVGAFVIGMLLTPPDIISQTLLAVPMWLLFELGVFFSRRFVRGRETAQEAEPSIMPPQAAAAAATATATSEAAPSVDDEDYRELSEEEMEAELDSIEAEEVAEDDATSAADTDREQP